jgi:hypothetical protein
MKDAYWFRHDSNARNDEKIIDLRGDLGYEGYGIYWALIEFLRDTDNYEAEYKPKRLAVALQADEGLIKQVIESYRLFCADDNGKFYSESLKARMKEMDRKREQQRQKAIKRWNPSSETATESDNESPGNATALPDYSHKNRIDNNKKDDSKAEKNRGDERVQGEKEAISFFSECITTRNAYPVILIFEYLYFVGKFNSYSIQETRTNFLAYWKDSGPCKNGEDIKFRLITMAKNGFRLSLEETRIQLDIFHQNQTKEKTEAEYYVDFLSQLKRAGFKPVNEFKAIASPYLKF